MSEARTNESRLQKQVAKRSEVRYGTKSIIPLPNTSGPFSRSLYIPHDSRRKDWSDSGRPLPTRYVGRILGVRGEGGLKEGRCAVDTLLEEAMLRGTLNVYS